MDVQFEQLNESFLRIIAKDTGIDQELSEFFCFMMPGAKFTPKFRSGLWDGLIRIYDLRTKKLPKGLLKVAVRFCKDRNYSFQIDPALNPKTNIPIKEIEDFVDSIDVTSKGKSILVRDYQREAIKQSLTYYRNLLLSPTSSGKQLILYYKLRYHIDILEENVLIIVPTTQLVEQLFSDFADYSSNNGWGVEEHCQMLYSGKEKIFSKNVMISTWQSLSAMAKHQPNVFANIVSRTHVVLADECIHPDSLITLKNNITKPIKEIKIGDEVLTLNEISGEKEYKKVVKIHHNISIKEKKYKIKLKSGKTIIITGNHKVMTQNGWKRTDELLVDDLICSQDI